MQATNSKRNATADILRGLEFPCNSSIDNGSHNSCSEEQGFEYDFVFKKQIKTIRKGMK